MSDGLRFAIVVFSIWTSQCRCQPMLWYTRCYAC